MPTSLPAQALLAFAIATCALALWKGGTAERVAALLILVNTTIFIAKPLLPASLVGVTFLMADAMTAFGMLALTLRYGSLWLGGAMLLYAAQFALHAYYFVTERPADLFKATVNNLNFLGILLCLALGIATAVRRRAAAANSALD